MDQALATAPMRWRVLRSTNTDTRCDVWAKRLAHDAACQPFGMVGELRRKLGPIVLLVLLLFMGVGIMNIRVSAESFRACASVLHSGRRSSTRPQNSRVFSFIEGRIALIDKQCTVTSS